MPFERPQPGDRCKAYIVEVRKTAKGPQIVVSRTHPGLIKRLFELEVPEIADGIVEIRACAREPGHRTKIAVWSNDHNVDPVGACVGARGGRVRMVVNELRGEKIDIVPFSEDFTDFVAKALSPAKVSRVAISEDGTQADVIVPDHQLSLAIGREGQNARLAARLTGVRIDIRSETQLAEGVQPRSDLEAGVEYAEGQWIQNAASGEMEWHAADGTVMSETEWAASSGEPAAEAVEVAAEPAEVRRAGGVVEPAEACGRAGRGCGRAGGWRAAEAEPRGCSRAGRGCGGRQDRCWRTKTRRPLLSSTGQPERTCIGCRTRRPQAALIRVARRPDGSVLTSRTAAGRGAWLCNPADECLQIARKRRGFDKAFRQPVSVAALDELVRTLREVVRG